MGWTWAAVRSTLPGGILLELFTDSQKDHACDREYRDDDEEHHHRILSCAHDTAAAIGVDSELRPSQRNPAFRETNWGDIVRETGRKPR
jgi:hypothetical protein